MESFLSKLQLSTGAAGSISQSSFEIVLDRAKVPAANDALKRTMSQTSIRSSNSYNSSSSNGSKSNARWDTTLPSSSPTTTVNSTSCPYAPPTMPSRRQTMQGLQRQARTSSFSSLNSRPTLMMGGFDSPPPKPIRSKIVTRAMMNDILRSPPPTSLMKCPTMTTSPGTSPTSVMMMFPQAEQQQQQQVVATATTTNTTRDDGNHGERLVALIQTLSIRAALSLTRNDSAATDTTATTDSTTSSSPTKTTLSSTSSSPKLATSTVAALT